MSDGSLAVSDLH